MSNFVKIGNTSELKPGENKVVNVNDTEIALFNIDGEFFAIDNICPHKGGPLGEGSIEGDVVVCPWHGWRFNVKTGVSPVVPTVKVPKYNVKVENNEIFVELE